MKQIEMYGLEAKGMKTHAGHEGEPLRQANIYFNNKKVMWYSDGDWGSSARYDFFDVDKETRDKVNDALNKISQNISGPFEGDDEIALDEVLKMKQYETDLKKHNKKFPSIIVVFQNENGIDFQAYSYKTTNILTPGEVKNFFPEVLDRAKYFELYRLNDKKQVEKYQHQF